ncbi:hypothetical protein B0A50_05686 [Salinomyces thailandicus]|uniref:Protein kinase domain-containing protein n=1 Tax=Salinomyces thailandicus TaxID=706561 RepID=A0A4U0TRF4_9PEZI|nr:hypothetical protein B0A50_05686 [Salinomyces thailandica]
MATKADLSILDIKFEPSTAECTVRFRDVECTLTTSPANLASDIKSYQYYLSVRKDWLQSGSVAYQQARSALEDLLITPFLDTIGNLGLQNPGADPASLRTLVKCRKYRLRLDEDGEIYIQNDGTGPTCVFAPAPLPDSYLDVLCLDVSEIITENCVSTWPDQVSVKGEMMFFKPLADFKPPELFWRELDALVRLNRQEVPGRLARLKGLATTDDGGTVVGLLTIWIEGQKLADTSVARRQVHSESWCKQVLETVQNVHDAEVLWGDVNAHNVLIDKEEIAWLVDFDGAAAEIENGLLPSTEMKAKEKRAVSKMFETIRNLSPEESRSLGPFY